MKAGQIRQWSAQNDPYRGSYKLIKSVGGRKWEIEYMDPTDEEMDMILSDVEGARYKDPEVEIMERIELAGTRKVVKFASQKDWNRYF